MPQKAKKVKMVVYLSKEVHDCIMEAVLAQVNVEKSFNVVLSDFVEECIREYFRLLKKGKIRFPQS